MTILRQASYALLISFAAYNIAQILVYFGVNIRVYNFVPGECSVLTLSDEEIYASGFVALSDRILFPYISVSKKTGFFTFESKNKSATKLDFSSKNLQEFHPEGLSEDTVEIISVAKDGNSLKHLSTVRSKKFIGLRDLAAVGKNQFFATSWIEEKNEFSRFIQEYFSFHSGAVVFFDGTTTKYVDRKISSPYGIVFDKEHKSLYVASHSTERILVYTVSESFSIKRKGEIELKSSPSLMWQGMDRSLVVSTHHLIRYRSLFHRTNETGYFAPTSILRVHTSFTFSDKPRIDTMYANDGATISAATSVIVTGSSLLISGSNTPILSCKLQPYVSFTLS